MENEFVQMIDQHCGILYKVCNLYCDKQEERQDLFQEIVLQLWKAFPTFRGESKFSTWMYRVAINVAIALYRKDTRNPLRQKVSLTGIEIPDLSDFADDSERLSILKQAIELLSKTEKAIIMLYLEEKSYDEISEIIGITKTHVGVKLNRIKTKLEKLINPK